MIGGRDGKREAIMILSHVYIALPVFYIKQSQYLNTT